MSMKKLGFESLELITTPGKINWVNYNHLLIMNFSHHNLLLLTFSPLSPAKSRRIFCLTFDGGLDYFINI